MLSNSFLEHSLRFGWSTITSYIIHYLSCNRPIDVIHKHDVSGAYHNVAKSNFEKKRVLITFKTSDVLHWPGIDL